MLRDILYPAMTAVFDFQNENELTFQQGRILSHYTAAARQSLKLWTNPQCHQIFCVIPYFIKLNQQLETINGLLINIRIHEIREKVRNHFEQILQFMLAGGQYFKRFFYDCLFNRVNSKTHFKIFL